MEALQLLACRNHIVDEKENKAWPGKLTPKVKVSILVVTLK